MATYGFAAVVTGLDVEDFDQLDRLFTEDFDIAPGDMDGVTTLEVEVEASSGEEALKIFHDHICKIEDVTIERIDEDLVNTSEIAVRLDVSRETPRTWANQANDVGIPFPKHRTVVGSPGKPQRLWCWADVYAWVQATGRADLDHLPVPPDSAAVTWFNAQLLRQVEHADDMTFVIVDVPERPRALGQYTEIDYRRSSATLYRARSARTFTATAARSGAGWLGQVTVA